MDEEAEEFYESEADYYEEDEEFDEEVEDEDDEIDKEDEEDAEIDYDAEIEEIDESKHHPVIQNINEFDENHKITKIRPYDTYLSSHIIQYPEMVEAIGIRLSQIENGSPVFTDVSGYTSPIDMAKKEFIDRKSPWILERAMKRSGSEDEVEQWKVREMTFPLTNKEILAITERQITSILDSKKRK